MLDIPRWTEEDSVEKESLELSLWTQKEAGSIALCTLSFWNVNAAGRSQPCEIAFDHLIIICKLYVDDIHSFFFPCF